MTRLGRGDATRQRILDAIQEQPGLNKLQVQQELGIGWGTTIYNLEVLADQGLVRFVQDRGHVRIFDAAFDVSGPDNPVIISEFIAAQSDGMVHPGNPTLYKPARQRFYNFVSSTNDALEDEGSSQRIVGLYGHEIRVMGGEIEEAPVKHYWKQDLETAT